MESRSTAPAIGSPPLPHHDTPRNPHTNMPRPASDRLHRRVVSNRQRHRRRTVDCIEESPRHATLDPQIPELRWERSEARSTALKSRLEHSAPPTADKKAQAGDRLHGKATRLS